MKPTPFIALSSESQDIIVDTLLGNPPIMLTDEQREEITAWANTPENFTKD